MSEDRTDSQAFIAEVKSIALKQGLKDLPDGEFCSAFFHRFPDLSEYAIAPTSIAEALIKCRRVFGEVKNKPLIHLEGDNLIIVNADMPFIVDSISNELSRQGLEVSYLLHPIIRAARDNAGVLQTVGSIGEPESLLYVKFKLPPAVEAAGEVKRRLSAILDAVKMVHQDSDRMRQKLVEEASHQNKSTDAAEIRDFANWMLDDNFIFLGVEEYEFAPQTDGLHVNTVPGSSLGVFRMDNESPDKPRGLLGLEPSTRLNALKVRDVEFSKSTRKSIVHRLVPMDYVAFKRLNDKGEVVGEARFAGIFSSKSRFYSVANIPIIRRKVESVLEKAGVEPDSFDEKTLSKILESYPRDEMFQIGSNELARNASSILMMEVMRGGIKVFLRKDIFERYISAIIYLPREALNTHNRIRIQSYLEKEFQAKYYIHFTQVKDSPHARVLILLSTIPGKSVLLDEKKVEREISRIITNWEDSLASQVTDKGLLPKYLRAFPPAYKSLYSPEVAAVDIANLERCLGNPPVLVTLERADDNPSRHKVIIYNSSSHDIALSDVVPVLENMGARVFHERPFVVIPLNSESHVVREVEVELPLSDSANYNDIKNNFELALTGILSGEGESDSFNRLILSAGLPTSDVNIFRMLAAYLRQIKFPFGGDYIARILDRNSSLAVLLARAFDARFNPLFEGERKTAFSGLIVEIEHKLTEVANADDDRVIRKLTEILQCINRTNFYQQRDGKRKSYISIKLDTGHLSGIPLPRPYAEIFVYSRRFEGVHLRGGKVARGGLRWSDRREDFRTEVLGLMKAQMVKNSVIVPTGAKGGFVLKESFAGRDDFMKAGVECYKDFLRGLLDVTDNIIAGKANPPVDVIMHDGEDPYLVVAADKGTATFSDYANQISAEYGFWLGDAFASGGSAGYDHKKMAITAKGAWVSVVRHFRELGMDISRQDFTAVGVGDMAGDVFGNGMLLSDKMKLLGAFNHMHIFVDPTPDPLISYQERKRLFELPRSSWRDYDARLISRGGGVFERSTKSIAVSDEMKNAFGIKVEQIAPDELIKAILTAPVDLLWNGGIGTYVKSSFETHEQVGDKANDSLRVNGQDLRCKIVGEGGNLGFTQLGRVEYALSGGKINTDAIDNSGGVDCSDHEVNIKIVFSAKMSGGGMEKQERDKFLEAMTDEVGRLVLADNRLQTSALTIAENQGYKFITPLQRLIRKLEGEGLLNRALEFLPLDEELEARKAARQGMTRPELAVLLAYSKIYITHALLASSLPDDPYFAGELARYFPKQMQNSLAEEIAAHPLKREIITTATTNSMVNRVGMAFVNQVMEETGHNVAEIAKAYTLARDVFSLRDTWLEVEKLDGVVDYKAQVEVYSGINEHIHQFTLWFLRNFSYPLNIGAIADEYKQEVENFRTSLDLVLSEKQRRKISAQVESLISRGIPESLARAVSELDAMRASLDIIKVAKISGVDVKTAANVYLSLAERLSLDTVVAMAASLSDDGHMPSLAATALGFDAFDEIRRLSSNLLNREDGREPAAVDTWAAANAESLARYDTFLEDVKSAQQSGLPSLIMLIKRLQSLSA